MNKKKNRETRGWLSGVDIQQRIRDAIDVGMRSYFFKKIILECVPI